MILLDTNVLIYAFDPESRHGEWARQTIADGVAGNGAAINAMTLAELCVGDEAPSSVADRVRSWGVQILDVPAATADRCAHLMPHDVSTVTHIGEAYRQRRRMMPTWQRSEPAWR